MLHIFVCEDDKAYREILTKWIKDIIMIENYDMKFELAVSSPEELVSHIKDNDHAGLYFLDIELNSSMDGIQLAEKIREYDPRGFIVFITSHGESLELTFKYKVEPMDYIVKSPKTDVYKEIQKCMISAKEKYFHGISELQKNLVVKSGGTYKCERLKDILFIETSGTSRKLVMHSVNRSVMISSQLNEIETQLDEDFYKCDKSVIVNLKMIEEVDNKTGNLILKDGSKCPFSKSRKGKMLELLKNIE